MFKKIVAAAAVLAIALLSLAGCGGDRYSAVKIVGKQDTAYRVESQGGSAVQYGDYIYFINGTSGYADEDGEGNLFGDVVKGALYRAKLLGEKKVSTAGGNVYLLSEDTDGSKLTLATTKTADYKGDNTYVVDVELIAPKRIGTDGYKDGGLFIFGDYIYYASPNNRQDKHGAFKYGFTDFFRMSLDGKKTQKLYTSEYDNAAKPYMFYHYGNAVYIAVLEGTNLKSVKIDAKSGAKKSTVTLAEDVTNVVFPVKPVYFDGISTDTIYDFIYIERSASLDFGDPFSEGKVLEFLRPDNSVLDSTADEKAYRVTFANSTGTLALNSVRDGMVFYTMTASATQTSLYATNLHQIMYDNVKSVRDAVDAATKDGKLDTEKLPYGFALGNYSESVLTLSDLSSRTLYPYLPDYSFFGAFVPGYDKDAGRSNSVQVLTVLESNIELYSGKNLTGSVTATEAPTIYTVDNGVVYYGAGTALNAADFRAGAVKDGTATTTQINAAFTAGTYGADIAANYVVYFATAEGGATDADGTEKATGYTHFKTIDGLAAEKFDKIFVGEMLEDELPSPYESFEIVELPDKIEYKKGEKKFDYSGIVIKAVGRVNSDNEKIVEDTDDLGESEGFKFKDEYFTGFDTSTAGSMTVTFTYERKSQTFELTVLEDETSGCGSISFATPMAAVSGILLLGACAIILKRKKYTN